MLFQLIEANLVNILLGESTDVGVLHIMYIKSWDLSGTIGRDIVLVLGNLLCSPL